MVDSEFVLEWPDDVHDLYLLRVHDIANVANLARNLFSFTMQLILYFGPSKITTAELP